jgi:hypothetical protein
MLLYYLLVLWKGSVGVVKLVADYPKNGISHLNYLRIIPKIVLHNCVSLMRTVSVFCFRIVIRGTSLSKKRRSSTREQNDLENTSPSPYI